MISKRIITANLAGTPWTYTANNLNQYSAFTINQVAETPSYDDDGNMLTRDGWTQTWNGENRLIKAEKGMTKLEFAYDYMGRRIFKKVYNGETLTSHIRFVYDGYKLIEELNAQNNNAVLRRYAWSPVGVDTPLSVYDAAANATYYYHTDANKNITELTDATGAVVAHYEYSPFGKVLVANGAYASINPFRFSSEYHDDESSLVYYNYRYYSPELGRWLTPDPIMEQGAIGLYTFNLNNSIYYYDVLGLTPKGPTNNKDGTVSPGDSDWYNKHKNPTAAARARGRSVNPKSKRQNSEFCGMICKKCDKSTGKNKYFTTQVKGTIASCIPTNAPCPADSITVGGWHTHGGNDPKYDNENFSDVNGDKDWADNTGMDLYLITPDDRFKHYIPDGSKPDGRGTVIDRGVL